MNARSDPPPAPRVTIVVPAYNSARCIEATLDTVLKQTFQDFEILVVDDGSSDNTTGVVGGVAARDGRVHLLTQAHAGLSAARNRGVAAARGEFIAFLDHDDLWLPEKLALQVEILVRQHDVSVVSCYSALVDEHYRCLGWRFGTDATGDVYAGMLECDMVSGGSVVLVRRSALDAAGPFDEALGLREDWDLWIRLARRVRFATIPRALVAYTRVSSNLSRDYEGMAAEGTLVLQKVLADDPAFGERFMFCQARDYFSTACFCAIDDRPELAWRYLARSVRCSLRPLLTSPRRWAFVGTLVLQSLLPPTLFRSVFGMLSRRTFELEPGRSFLSLAAPL